MNDWTGKDKWLLPGFAPEYTEISHAMLVEFWENKTFTDLHKLRANNPNMDVIYTLHNDCSPIHFVAGYNGDPEVIQSFCDIGVNRFAKDMNGRTALHYAAGNLKIPKETMRILMDAGLDINEKDRTGRETPLDLAEENHVLTNHFPEFLEELRKKTNH